MKRGCNFTLARLKSFAKITTLLLASVLTNPVSSQSPTYITTTFNNSDDIDQYNFARSHTMKCFTFVRINGMYISSLVELPSEHTHPNDKISVDSKWFVGMLRDVDIALISAVILPRLIVLKLPQPN
ncbi:MAG: hypothetical protein OEQ53_05915 [Saprospiraceae bacterium]|nr:hypothetical protein [Saprospiraceae bacterium]